MSERITSDIVQRLRSRLPGLDLAVRTEGDLDHVRLPSAPTSDYAFELVFANGHEASLNASLVGSEVGPPEETYFWYVPFEEAAYTSYDARAQEIASTVDSLLRNRSRIIQAKGLLFWSLKAEVQSGGEWKPLYSLAALKHQFRAPNINGRRKEYYADAVIGAARPVV